MAPDVIFCSSLRQRYEWAKVLETPPSMNMPKWSELYLDNHDLAVPFSWKNNADLIEYFRFILISPSDLQEVSNPLARIENAYYKYGGTNLGILLLLNEVPCDDNRSVALMSIQASLFPSLEIPVLPLSCIELFQNTIFAFQQQLMYPLSQMQQKNSEISLLPYCSINPPIEGHARNILSDMCSSILELEALTSQADGLERISSMFTENPQFMEEVIEFWRDEYIAD